MTPTRTTLATVLAAAALVFGAPAAQATESCGFADPDVQGGWVATDCFPTDPEGQAVPDQPQMAEETTDRQIDCPDGQVGRVQGDMVICPAPAPTAAAPTAAAPAAASASTPVAAAAVPVAAAPRGDAPVTVDTAQAPALVSYAVFAQRLVALLRSCMPWLFGTVR